MNDYSDAIRDAYSYRRPAAIVGQSLMNGMIAGGLTEAEALSLLYSKAYRWALDFKLGDALKDLAESEGQRLAQEYRGHEWTQYELPQHAKLKEGAA